MYICYYKRKCSIMQQNTNNLSSKTRRMIDVSAILDQLQLAAIDDSKLTGNLYNLTDYCRDIIKNYIKLKQQRPNITPADLPKMKI